MFNTARHCTRLTLSRKTVPDVLD